MTSLSQQIQEDRAKKIWSGSVPDEDKHFSVCSNPDDKLERHPRPPLTLKHCVVCGTECWSRHERPVCSRNCAGKLGQQGYKKGVYYNDRKRT